MASKQPETFNLHVPDAALADLRERLSRTRFPDQAPSEPWAYGTDLNWMAGFVDYWRDGFDWRAQEARRRPFKPSAMGGREGRAFLWNPVKSALIKDLRVIKGVFSRIAQNARI